MCVCNLYYNLLILHYAFLQLDDPLQTNKKIYTQRKKENEYHAIIIIYVYEQEKNECIIINNDYNIIINKHLLCISNFS